MCHIIWTWEMMYHIIWHVRWCATSMNTGDDVPHHWKHEMMCHIIGNLRWCSTSLNTRDDVPHHWKHELMCCINHLTNALIADEYHCWHLLQLQKTANLNFWIYWTCSKIVLSPIWSISQSCKNSKNWNMVEMRKEGYCPFIGGSYVLSFALCLDCMQPVIPH